MTLTLQRADGTQYDLTIGVITWVFAGEREASAARGETVIQSVETDRGELALYSAVKELAAALPKIRKLP